MTPKKPNERIELAKITLMQAVLVAAITAAAGLVTGYFGKQKIGQEEVSKTSATTTALETKMQTLQADFEQSKRSASESLARLTEANKTISGLSEKVQSLEKDLQDSRGLVTKTAFELSALKQRVRDILGPKDDAIKRMSQSLERMKGDIGVSPDHRERLAEIVQQLDKIDTKVLGIVE